MIVWCGALAKITSKEIGRYIGTEFIPECSENAIRKLGQAVETKGLGSFAKVLEKRGEPMLLADML